MSCLAMVKAFGDPNTVRSHGQRHGFRLHVETGLARTVGKRFGDTKYHIH